MKLPMTRDALSSDQPQSEARPVPRIKRSPGTSFCAGASASWANVRRAAAPYHFGQDCFCLSPEQHGAQFRQEGWELRSLKGHC